MPNARDHAAAIGQQPLSVRPFDEMDALILTQIVYMPMEGRLDRGETAPLAELWGFLQSKYPEGFSDVFQQKRYELLETCASVPRYQGWQLYRYTNIIDHELEMQFCACSFDLPGGQTFIAFRGTDWTLTGWKEDFNMSFMTVPSQREAVEYAERVAAENGNALMLGGHSKGGNLSVYAGARVGGPTRERIRRVYSFDGPGVDKETMDSGEYALLSERIESYLPQSSIVGMLLYYHPVYTVVKSDSYGILQHDAMTWQVEDGAFIMLQSINYSVKVTDEALHEWLQSVDLETRRKIVDTLYMALESTLAETLDDLVVNWHQAARSIWEKIHGLPPEMRKNILHMMIRLFKSSAAGMLKGLLPHVRLQLGEPEAEDEKL